MKKHIYAVIVSLFLLCTLSAMPKYNNFEQKSQQVMHISYILNNSRNYPGSGNTHSDAEEKDNFGIETYSFPNSNYDSSDS